MLIMALASSTTPSRIKTIGASGQEARSRTVHSPPMRNTPPQVTQNPSILMFISDDGVERLRARKKTHVKTEHQSGPEDTEYGVLLRVARAVEEARREIDLQALQRLVEASAAIPNRAMRGSRPLQMVQRSSSRKPGSTSLIK